MQNSSNKYGVIKGGNRRRNGDRKKLVNKEQVHSMLDSFRHLYLEEKYFLTDLSGTVSTGDILAITSIPQGDTDLTRDGDAININRLDILGSILGSDVNNLVRLVVFRWNEATVPALADVFESPSTYGVHSPMKHDTRNLYHVLYDKLFSFIPDSGSYQHVMQMRLSVPKQQVRFVAAGTTGSNKLYVGIISDSVAVPNPEYRIVTKIWFHDA